MIITNMLVIQFAKAGLDALITEQAHVSDKGIEMGGGLSIKWERRETGM